MSEIDEKKSLFKKSDALIAAFVVPVIVMIIIFIQRGIFPFGDRSFLRTDMYHQYAPFFSEFQYKLQHAGSLLYSWNVGMGVNFSAIYAYYLASPLNWFIAFVPKAYVLEFMTYGIVLKIGLAGLTMAIYLNSHGTKTKFASAFFAIFYALSGYVSAYSWNIMWLDCIILLPIIVLGLEKMVREKKGILYVIALGVCIASNYYISFMICIFLVLYFFMLLIVEGVDSFRDFAAACLHFAFYSLIAAAIAAAVVLPELFALQSTASGDITFPKTVSQYFSIIDEFARHMVNVDTEQTLDHWPNIYCGAAIFPLIIMYVLNKKIALKEKITYAVVLMLFLASFSLNIFNFIWHGFHYPNSLPCRQAFIYIFLLLYTGFRAIDNIDGIELRDIGIAAVVSVLFVLYCQKAIEDDAFKIESFYITLGFIGIYCVMVYLYRSGKMNVNIIAFIVLAFVAVESAVNMTSTSVTTTSRNDYINDNANVAAVRTLVADDTDFYRFEKEKRKTKDDGAWMNFRSVSLFSSTASASMSTLFKQLGCEASTNAYSIIGSTPLVDALFDVKYTISTGESRDESKTHIGYSDNIHLYRNKCCLPLGYMVPGDLEDNWLLDRGNPVLVQNDLCTVLGTANVLDQIDGFHEEDYYSATIPESGLYYAFSENLKTDKIEVTIRKSEDDIETRTVENMKRGYLIELGWCEKNTIVDISSKNDTKIQTHIYKFNYDSLQQLTDILGQNPMTINYFNDTHIDATVTADKRGVLLLSIPYEKGWKILVDGQLQTARTMFGGLMGLDLSEGTHTVQMTFVPDGLTEGTYLMFGGLALLLALIVIRIILNRKAAKDKENEDFEESRLDPHSVSAGGSGDSTGGDPADEDENEGAERNIVLLDKPDILNTPDEKRNL